MGSFCGYAGLYYKKIRRKKVDTNKQRRKGRINLVFDQNTQKRMPSIRINDTERYFFFASSCEWELLISLETLEKKSVHLGMEGAINSV